MNVNVFEIENLWKRQSFGKLSKSGDMKLIRRLLKRQVHFIIHSTTEEIWVLAQVIFDSKRTDFDHALNLSNLLSKYLAETIKKFVLFTLKNLVPELKYLNPSLFCLLTSVFGLCFVFVRLEGPDPG